MSKNHLENFLPSLIIALQDMLLERESRPEKLFLRIKSLDLFSVFLTDNKHIFEGEIIHSCTPKKAFSAIDSKSIGLNKNESYTYYF